MRGQKTGMRPTDELMHQADRHIRNAERLLNQVPPGTARRNLEVAVILAAQALLEAKQSRVAGFGNLLVREFERLFVKTGEVDGRLLAILRVSCEGKSGDAPGHLDADLPRTFEGAKEFINAAHGLLMDAELGWLQRLGDKRYDFTPPRSVNSPEEFGEHVMNRVRVMQQVDEKWKN